MDSSSASAAVLNRMPPTHLHRVCRLYLCSCLTGGRKRLRLLLLLLGPQDEGKLNKQQLTKILAKPKVSRSALWVERIGRQAGHG